MRKHIVAGNWKMNNSLEMGIELAGIVNQMLSLDKDLDVLVVLAVPFIHLKSVIQVVDSNKILIGAQNCSSEPQGAFTGEVSAGMISSTGAKYVIIGHSERRSIFGEDDAVLLKKVRIALENQLIPIFCVGENLSERESAKFFETVRRQLNESVFRLNVSDFEKLVIAYEPVWAIGTGVNASPAQAQEMHAFIRELIKERFGRPTSDGISILYGGSCKASNARELFSNPDVDGGLIGGASLIAEEFVKIIHSF